MLNQDPVFKEEALDILQKHTKAVEDGKASDLIVISGGQTIDTSQASFLVANPAYGVLKLLAAAEAMLATGAYFLMNEQTKTIAQEKIDSIQHLLNK